MLEGDGGGERLGEGGEVAVGLSVGEGVNGRDGEGVEVDVAEEGAVKLGVGVGVVEAVGEAV